MNAHPPSAEGPQPAQPRFDRKFVEENKLIERYLESKLPLKGARELENWCRSNPEYLNELKLSERAENSIKLLEASGQPPDLREPKTPWWKTIYVLIGLSIATLCSLIALWLVLGKFALLRSELDDARTVISRGPLVQPATESNLTLAPDRAAGIDHARIIVNRNAPQLMDLHIDLNYTNKLTQFRVLVDKKDQGRALILNNVLKDSNGELRITINSTGLAAGIYNVRIEALPFNSSPLPIGWLILEVR